jgi:uncharacterized protein (DUF1810 family)
VNDRYNLARFVKAQDLMYESVVTELRAGQKRGHWIWYVFPQISGLGRSAANVKYSISSLDEARAYLAHPVLGPRLIECTTLLLACRGHTAEQILGADAVKLRSSMTLFAAAAAGHEVFQKALDHFFDGRSDPLTTQKLEHA